MSTCAISGVVPEQPVVSKTTGYIFERRLILKHLELHQTCPISHTPLTTNDLLSIQTTSPVVPPRAPTQISFPQLLSTLQNEYDSMLLETFALRQQLDLVKKDLAKQYYTLDAANRVIARLYKENKELRDGLQTANPSSRLIHQAQNTTTSQSLQQIVENSAQIGVNLTFKPSEFIHTAIDRARSMLSGKPNRGVVAKQLQTTLPDASKYMNPIISLDNSITLGSNTTFTPQSAQTQFEMSTLVTLNEPKLTQQFSFIPTTNNSVVVVMNDTALPNQPPIMTTIQLPSVQQHSTVSITALVTTTLNARQFPWIGNLINGSSNDSEITTTSMSDLSSSSSFISFIVSTSTTTNQHNIYIYACSTAINGSIDQNNQNWKCLHTIKTSYPIKSLSIHPSQQLLFSLSSITNTIDIYNISQPQHQIDLTSNDYTTIIDQISLPNDQSTYGYPISINSHPDCSLIGIGFSQLGSVQAYNFTTKLFSQFQQPSITEFPYPITQIEFTSTATHFISVSHGNGFQIWNLVKQNLIYTQKILNLSSFALDMTGTYVFIGCLNEIYIYLIKSNEKIATITIPKENFIASRLIVQQDNKGLMVIGQKDVFIVYPNLA